MAEERPTVLIIDDSRTVIKSISVAVGKRYRVYSATDGETGVAQAVRLEPDLILMDVEMPGIDGYETCKRIKEVEKLADVPVIYLSSHDETEDILKGFIAGGSDYLTKSADHDELLARIDTHISGRLLKMNLANELRNKDNLIQSLCHDLSNPMSALLGYLDMLRKRPAIISDETALRYLSGLDGIIKQTVDLLEQIKEIHALEIGATELELEPVDLRSVLADTLEIFQKPFADKQLKAVCSPKLVDIQQAVLANRVAFRSHVLSNLISNAVKYSFPGDEVLIEIEDAGQRVRLSVADSGIGIPKNLIDNLFQPGTPTSRVGTKGEAGTGFGLPLAKTYLDHFGGTISVVSPVCKDKPDRRGSRFDVFLKKA